jgi:hypothetical protein
MSIPLADALAQVDLEPGRTYRCQVKGRLVEVKMLDTPSALLPDPLVESDIMLDPWVELPGPEASRGVVVSSRIGEPDLPDPPDIPREGETL